MKPSKKIDDESWMKHFMKLLGGIKERTIVKIVEEEKRKEGLIKIVEPINMEELKRAIFSLKKKKAAGCDGITSEMWQFSFDVISENLLQFMNSFWEKNVIPEEWKCGVVVPVYKRGEVENASNYRGIALMGADYKIYTSIMKERILAVIEEKNIYSETQMGFRAERSTIDAIYIIKNVVQSMIEKKKKVFAVFVDLSAAFDNVDRHQLWNFMVKKGIDEELARRAIKIYEETKNLIRVNNKEIGEFWMYRGIRQGCRASGMAFNIYLCDLEEEMKNVNEGGVVVGNKKVWSIGYADDIVLLSTEENAMKEMIDRLEKYLEKKNLNSTQKRQK